MALISAFMLLAQAGAVTPPPASPENPAADQALSTAAAADGDADALQSRGDVIIVTARRRTETAQDVPLAISVIRGDSIEATGNFNVLKLQQLAPTLQAYTSNPRNTSVNIRGLGVPFGLTSDGFEQGVGIYVDDVYNSRVAAATFDFLDVAQVGPHHRHRVVVGHDCLGPHEHHRVVVDVDDAGAGLAEPGHLVRVRADRQPGADVKELPDAGVARERDHLGRSLPQWRGCAWLGEGDVFVMNVDVSDSFDGRYFGVLPRSSILGRAVPVWTDARSHDPAHT